MPKNPTPAQRRASAENLKAARAKHKAGGTWKAKKASLRKSAMESRFGKRKGAEFYTKLQVKRSESKSFGVKRGAFIQDQTFGNPSKAPGLIGRGAALAAQHKNRAGKRVR